ncbi:MAG: D-alanine--D-alanine ligase [Ruminococcaceae bacterium]|nr:D-alanine--D-alanine ligase [Oscillospiraceae bacterium]
MDILVLYGGSSPERAVSVSSAQAVLGALAESKHRMTAIDYRGGALDEALLGAAARADAVFLCLHGGEEEGGVLQARLEESGICHYTGSAPAAAALALDKARAKHCVASAGVPIASGQVWQPGELAPALPLPAVLKPLCGGSSVGVCTLHDENALAACHIKAPMLLEEYLPGREYSVGIIDKNTLPAVELRPKGGFYDYAHKYTPGATDELCPAPVSAEKSKLLADLALTAFSVLGLRDVARIDFKENAAGIPCFLEANTLPGLTKTSLLPLAAAVAGMDFTALCEKMCALAAARKKR